MDKKQINNIKALNIGCGPVTRWLPHTEGLDMQDFGQKYVGDIMTWKPPYEYDVVFIHHVVEHIQDTIALFEKLGEIVKVGGVIDIRVPTLPFPQAHIDPTHVKFIPQQADLFFAYFTDKSMAGHCYTKCKYELVEANGKTLENDRYQWEAHVALKLIKKA